MNKCNHVYNGLMFGFMCRRLAGHTGRHMWWVGRDSRNSLYWRSQP